MIKIDLFSGDALAKVLHYYNYPSDGEKIVCPFHQDVYPSMQVNFNTGSCFCYGCQKSYDTLSLVKGIEQISDDLKACMKLSYIMTTKKVSKIKAKMVTIKIIADGIMLNYEAIPFSSKVRSIVAKPIAGCYRITVPTEHYHNIRCELEWNCEPIENTGSSGERFLCSEYERGNTILTIGAEDENDAYETVRYENGMGYNIVQPTEKVVFGIAWATDHEDGDVRTWLAADPS